VARVHEPAPGRGTHAVLEAMGHREALEQAVGVVRSGGVISRVGAPQYAETPVGGACSPASPRSPAGSRRLGPTGPPSRSCCVREAPTSSSVQPRRRRPTRGRLSEGESPDSGSRPNRTTSSLASRAVARTSATVAGVIEMEASQRCAAIQDTKPVVRCCQAVFHPVARHRPPLRGADDVRGGGRADVTVLVLLCAINRHGRTRPTHPVRPSSFEGTCP
jgi:hypothetical protein